MRRLFFDDEGASAVIVALVMTVLIGFTAIAVDVGYMYSERRQLQTAADAAALAGCRVLADGGNAQAAVDEYAAKNAIEPGDALYVEDTDIGLDYVQVTVAKDSPLFFAAIFGSDSSLIRATARAEIAYNVGLRNLLPWGVPVINEANKITVTLGGVEFELVDQGSGVWEKTITVPSSGSTTGYQMDVIAYNGQYEYPDGTTDPDYHPDGVPEYMTEAARVFVPESDSPISDVSLSHYLVTAGEVGTVQLTVESDGANKVAARFDGKNYNLDFNATTGLWQTWLPVPATDNLLETFPVNVSSDKYDVTAAATLVVRRTTYPVLDVELTDYVVATGGTTTVRVTINDYQYDQLYTLRVGGGGGEVGNFCALDLNSVRHTPNWVNPDPLAYPDLPGGTSTYYQYLLEGFPEAILIGDTIWTEPGGMSGPTSLAALTERFGDDSRTYEQWVAAGKPGSSRVVYLPIVEKMQTVTGTSPVRVVSFAAFYVEPDSDIKNNEIHGRFIEYVAPSDIIVEDQPDDLYVQTVRLVAPE